MNRTVIGLGIALLLLIGCNYEQKYAILHERIKLETWKFRTGDSLSYKNLNYNDNSWATLSSSKDWQSQGYANYQGYAWYRNFFVIHSVNDIGLTEDSVDVCLGIIDFNDLVYLNGNLLAENGKLAAPGYSGDTAFQKKPTPWLLWRFFRISKGPGYRIRQLK